MTPEQYNEHLINNGFNGWGYNTVQEIMTMDNEVTNRLPEAVKMQGIIEAAVSLAPQVLEIHDNVGEQGNRRNFERRLPYRGSHVLPTGEKLIFQFAKPEIINVETGQTHDALTLKVEIQGKNNEVLTIEKPVIGRVWKTQKGLNGEGVATCYDITSDYMCYESRYKGWRGADATKPGEEDLTYWMNGTKPVSIQSEVVFNQILTPMLDMVKPLPNPNTVSETINPLRLAA